MQRCHVKNLQNCTRSESWINRGPPTGPPVVPMEVATAEPRVCVILPKFALLISAIGLAKFV